MVELATILDREDRHCVGADPGLFVGDRGRPTEPARRLCAACPALMPCLQYALERPTMVGIWGGTDWDERQEIRRSRAAA